MKTSLLALGAAAVIAAPSFAHASCHDRRVTGALAGTVGGGLIGNAVSGGNRLPGTLLGAGLGALAGTFIGGAGCHDHAYYRHAYYRRPYYRHHHYRARYEPETYRSGFAASDRPDPAGPTRCEVRDQAFYDERGQLIHRTQQVCG